MNERLPDTLPEERKSPERNGVWLWKTLKPFGCILCLGLMVLMLIICFTAGRDPIKGYEAPRSTEYYAQNLTELVSELEENVLPQLEGIVSCELSHGKVAITIEQSVFASTRGAVLRYFDSSLFEFIME